VGYVADFDMIVGTLMDQESRRLQMV